jgi:hypothetical protein
MHERRNILHPLTRLMAALALAVFVVAQAQCALQCSGRPGAAASASCHAAPTASCCPSQGGAPLPCSPTASAACANLKTLDLADAAPVVWPAPEVVLWSLAEFFPALDDAAAPAHGFFPRPDGSANRLFTPEVFLGPAFRSLAPPPAC